MSLLNFGAISYGPRHAKPNQHSMYITVWRGIFLPPSITHTHLASTIVRTGIIFYSLNSVTHANAFLLLLYYCSLFLDFLKAKKKQHRLNKTDQQTEWAFLQKKFRFVLSRDSGFNVLSVTDRNVNWIVQAIIKVVVGEALRGIHNATVQRMVGCAVDRFCTQGCVAVG